MKILLPLLLVSGLAGCASEGPAAWAFDPITVQPLPDGRIQGFHTWQFYGEQWNRQFRQKHYVCGLVVEIFGDPVEPDEDCPGCEQVWDVQANLLETDCAPGDVEEEGTYTSLTRLGIGGVAADLLVDDPHPGNSDGGYADFGNGWEAHGWAYPSSLDNGTSASGWDGESQFTFWPALAWDVSTL